MRNRIGLREYYKQLWLDYYKFELKLYNTIDDLKINLGILSINLPDVSITGIYFQSGLKNPKKV